MPSRLSLDMFAEGFREACASAGVDPEELVKCAQAANTPQPRVMQQATKPTQPYTSTPATAGFELTQKDYEKRQRQLRRAAEARQARKRNVHRMGRVPSRITSGIAKPLTSALAVPGKAQLPSVGQLMPFGGFMASPEQQKRQRSQYYQQALSEAREAAGGDPGWSGRLGAGVKSQLRQFGQSILPTERYGREYSRAKRGLKDFWAGFSPEYAKQLREERALEAEMERNREFAEERREVLKQEMQQRKAMQQQERRAQLAARRKQTQWRKEWQDFIKGLRAKDLTEEEREAAIKKFTLANPKPKYEPITPWKKPRKMRYYRDPNWGLRGVT